MLSETGREGGGGGVIDVWYIAVIAFQRGKKTQSKVSIQLLDVFLNEGMEEMTLRVECAEVSLRRMKSVLTK